MAFKQLALETALFEGWHTIVMTAPRPQTIGNRLMDEVFYHLRQDLTPTDFEMRRMSRDAGKLDLISPIEGALAFAAIAAIKWDEAEMKAQIERLLSINSSPISLFNASLVWRTLNNSDQALELSRMAWLAAPADDTYQRGYFGTLVRSGYLLEAHDFAKSVALEGLAKEEVASLDRTVMAMKLAELTQERVVAELAVAFEVMKSHRIRNQRSGFATHRDPESGMRSLVAIVNFVGNYDDEAALTASIAEVMIDMPEWNPAQLAIRLVPFTEKDDELLAA